MRLFKNIISFSVPLLSLFLVLPSFVSFAQCTVDVFANPLTIVCGDQVNLSAYGNSGNLALNNDFNNGTPGTGWGATSAATFTNPCGPGTDGTTHLWMGDATPQPRTLTTVALNLSPGGQICFDLRFSVQADAAPCEGPDEPTEGVYLQYSTNGGSTWTTINYFDPLGGYDPTLTTWNNYCFNIPAGAMTGNTLIRWYQDGTSGAEYDHWGIDNVQIILNDPSFYYIWQHNMFNGQVPPPESPTQNTTYTVVYTNGTNVACTTSVNVIVLPPTILAEAGSDVTICPGDCTPLDATADVERYPHQNPTFENLEFQSVVSGLGSTTEINVNVQGLNNTTVGPAVIQSVCIEGLSFSDIPNLVLTLVCPSGASITLVPINGATGGYTNTCFVPGAPALSTGSSPYTGSFGPSQPFSNLNGCTSNGVWILRLTANTFIGFGTFAGWSITFDDPAIVEPGIFSWNPTTGLSNPNSLTPNACPAQTTTYTLTVEDQHHCAQATSSVTVTVNPNCCPMTIDNVAIVQPTCGGNNGSITITQTGGVAPVQYSIDNGVTFQASNVFNGLAAGNYAIVVEDAGCQQTDAAVLNNSSGPTINSVTPVNPTCGASDGTITINANGGQAPLQYSIDNGTTFQAGNAFNNLGTGNYNIVVKDANGCQATVVQALNNSNGPTIDNVADVAPVCGASDGTIDITASGGLAPLQYSIDNGVTFQATGSFANLGSGTYDIVVEDGNGCQAADQVVFNSVAAPVIDNLASTDPSCGASDGDITITASGGVAPLQYSIDNGVTFQATGNFPALASGTYDIVVEDNAGCSVTDQVVLAPSSAPVINSIGAIAPSCGASDGGIGIQASGGQAPLQYSIDGGVTFQALGAFQNLGTGTYDLVVEDATGCQVTDQVILNNLNGPTIDNLVSVDPACGASDGSIDITASGGTAPLQYSIDNGVTFQATGSFPALGAATYDIVVEDATGCQAADQVILGSSSAPSIDNMVATDASCGASDGTLTITASGGQAPLQYSIDNGVTFQASGTFNNLAPGAFDVVVQDATGCSVTDQTSVSNLNGPTITNLAFVDASCDGNNGTITITASGGAAPLQYSINNGVNFQATGQFNNLPDGNYTIIVEDNSGCQATDVVTIANTPAPKIDQLIVVNPTCGNRNAEITVVTSSGTTPIEYSINNGTTFQAGATFTALGPGTYTILIRDANGCTDNETVTISNSSAPHADFTFMPTVIDLLQPQEVNFNNNSTGAITYEWDFGGLATSTDENPSFEFPSDEPRNYQVCLTATNADNCEDIVCAVVIVEEGFYVYVPNAFTPNNTMGINDSFFPVVTGVEDYEFYIFDRWGGLLFLSNHTSHPWTGKNRSGELVPNDVYAWKFVINDEKHGKHIYYGHVTVVR